MIVGNKERKTMPSKTKKTPNEMLLKQKDRNRHNRLRSIKGPHLARGTWIVDKKKRIFLGVLMGPCVRYDDGTVIRFDQHVATHNLWVRRIKKDGTENWLWVRTPDLTPNGKVIR